MENFDISSLYKFVSNFKKSYDSKNINYPGPKEDLYLLYKNRIPEIDGSDKTYSIEFKTIEYKNNNYEKTLNDLISLENTFFKALSLIPIFKHYIKYFGALTYHNIGSIDRSIQINDLILLDYSDVKEDYTGSYHLWITCPYNKNLPMTDFLKIHESLANKLQLLEPVFLAHFGSPSYDIVGNKTSSKSSFRHFLNKFSNYGTTDISLINGRKKSLIDEYFFSEEDIINNSAFIPSESIYENIYIFDKNKNKKLKIDYNYLNTRNITNNLFTMFDKGSPASNNKVHIKNYMTMLFEETNIRPKTTFEEYNESIKKYYVKLGADFRTRDNNPFFYPLDKDNWVPKILVKNNKFIEVYFNPETKKISYQPIYDKSIYKKILVDERIGIEFRILDHFPTFYLNQILSILGSIVVNSLNNKKIIPLKNLHISKQYWHNEMFNVIKYGYEYELSPTYIKALNSEFSINIGNNSKNMNSSLFLKQFFEIMNRKYINNSFYDIIKFKNIVDFESFNKIAWFEILDSYFEKNPFVYKKLIESSKSNKNFNNIINIINKKNNSGKIKNYIMKNK